jgi:hypothetical protein
MHEESQLNIEKMFGRIRDICAQTNMVEAGTPPYLAVSAVSRSANDELQCGGISEAAYLRCRHHYCWCSD